MITGRTKSGFEYAVDEERLRDWGTVKKIARLMGVDDSTAQLRVVELVSEILGEGQEERLCRHVAGSLGYADWLAVIKEFFEIFSSAGEEAGSKNPPSSHGPSAGAGTSSYATSPSTTGSRGSGTLTPAPQRYY